MEESWFYFWKYGEITMKIMVTGGAGFIGSNFITNQINKGNIILNYDKLTYAGCIESLDSVKNHPNYHFKNGDISDSDTVAMAFNEFNPDDCIFPT